jgi:hypothetical protein
VEADVAAGVRAEGHATLGAHVHTLALRSRNGCTSAVDFLATVAHFPPLLRELQWVRSYNLPQLLGDEALEPAAVPHTLKTGVKNLDHLTKLCSWMPEDSLGLHIPAAALHAVDCAPQPLTARAALLRQQLWVHTMCDSTSSVADDGVQPSTVPTAAALLTAMPRLTQLELVTMVRCKGTAFTHSV